MLPTPDNTVGALLIGGMASAVLWGCTNMQTARYIINLRYREKEWLVYKIAVGSMPSPSFSEFTSTLGHVTMVGQVEHVPPH